MTSTNIIYPLRVKLFSETLFISVLLTPIGIGKRILEGLGDFVLQVFAKFFQTPNKN